MNRRCHSWHLLIHNFQQKPLVRKYRRLQVNKTITTLTHFMWTFHLLVFGINCVLNCWVAMIIRHKIWIRCCHLMSSKFFEFPTRIGYDIQIFSPHFCWRLVGQMNGKVVSEVILICIGKFLMDSNGWAVSKITRGQLEISDKESNCSCGSAQNLHYSCPTFSELRHTRLHKFVVILSMLHGCIFAQKAPTESRENVNKWLHLMLCLNVSRWSRREMAIVVKSIQNITVKSKDFRPLFRGVSVWIVRIA